MRCVPSRRPVVIGALLVLAATAVPARADKCISAKVKAFGKFEGQRLACYAKEAGKGDPTLFNPCAIKAQETFEKAFAKAGTCIPGMILGGLVDCLFSVQDCTGTVRANLPDAGPSKCEAARLKAAGKRAAGFLACLAKGDPATLADCQAKADTKFQAAYDKVSGCSVDGGSSAVATAINNECYTAALTLDGGGNV